MNAEILIYNVTDSDRLAIIRITAFRLGLVLKEIEKEQYSLPLGYLAGVNGIDGTAIDEDGDFDDEMLVMCDLDRAELNELIDSLRSENVIIPLKAMLTETNAKWSSLRLHREISAEHEAMKALSAKKQTAHPIHKRKKRK